MSVELLPLGKKCNIACSYCYQQDERTATGNSAPPYDMAAMKAALLAEGVGNGTGWSLFGGESLLLPINDFEELLRWSKERNAPVGIQTNGSLITSRHIELFKQYSVSVGVSIDGPDELNDARQARDPKATLATTELSQRNLERLLREGISTSLIVTLTSVNAGSGTRLGALIDWFHALRELGLRYINLHTLEPHGDSTLALTQIGQRYVLRRLREELTNFAQVNPFSDMRKSLLQESGTNCTWNFCDPYTTPAVRGIDGQGTRGNCGRTNKDGVGYVKSDRAGHERQLALYLTPMDKGGCGGCRFFLACGGGNCPGEGQGGDWRARTVHCETLTALFKDIEGELFEEGKEPISMSLRRPGLEAQQIARWTGQPTAVASNVPHGDRPHGDAPHGDSNQHGDHTDAGNKSFEFMGETLHHGDTPHTDVHSDMLGEPKWHKDIPHGDHLSRTA